MDRKSPEQAEIEQLLRVSRHARSQLSAEVTHLRHKLSIPLRIRDTLRRKPAAILAGSMLAGLATSFLLRRRRRKTEKKKILSKGLLALTLTAGRPLAKAWLSGKLRQWTTSALSRNQAPRSPFQLEPSESPTNVRTPGP